MMKPRFANKVTLFIGCIFLLLSCLVACSSTVSWLDADGEVIETMIPEEGQAIPNRPLPPDDDEWHYTGWKQEIHGGNTTYTAERIAKTKVIWQDADGTVLYTDSVIPGETPAVFNLPLDNEDWIYTGWQEETRDGELIYTAARIAKTKVYWRDTDGTLIHSESISPSSRIPDRDLPADSNAFVYTEWRKTESENTVTFTAQRVAAKTVIWRDADGTEIETQYLPLTQEIPQRDFPTNPKWDYVKWERTVSGTVYTYTAIGTPKTSYFAGNVFQIVATDLTENPISLGTGFVINSQGWFITNYHVLESACLAKGVFEIRNYKTNESYTTLSIEKISYFDKDKDIVIGRLENYASIANYYKNIPLQIRYNVGDVTYSVGYPEGTEKMEVHEGKVLRNVAGLKDKLYGGIDYVASDSYVAPGSSGGILVNDKLEVIGMVTRVLWDDNDEFVLSASIEAFNFQGLITSKSKTSMLQTITSVFYPELTEYADRLSKFKSNGNLELIEEEDIFFYKMELTETGTSSDGEKYTEKQIYLFYGNGYIVIDFQMEWESGEKREAMLYGNYMDGLDSFHYAYAYEFANGSGYAVYSEKINYSSNSSLSLINYKMEGFGSFYPGPNNLSYARARFNEIYKGAKNKLF